MLSNFCNTTVSHTIHCAEMPRTLFSNFFLSTVTYNVQHLELLSYTPIESYSFFSSVRCTELLLLKPVCQSVRALSSPFLHVSDISQSVRYHSEVVYYLESLYFYELGKGDALHTFLK